MPRYLQHRFRASWESELLEETKLAVDDPSVIDTLQSSCILDIRWISEQPRSRFLRLGNEQSQRTPKRHR